MHFPQPLEHQTFLTIQNRKVCVAALICLILLQLFTGLRPDSHNSSLLQYRGWHLVKMGVTFYDQETMPDASIILHSMDIYATGFNTNTEKSMLKSYRTLLYLCFCFNFKFANLGKDTNYKGKKVPIRR